MADFDESPKVSDEENGEQSTVFSAPAEHNDKKTELSKKRMITTVIAAVLAVCLLVGGTLAVIRFIPKRETDEETTSSEFQKVTVLDLESGKFDGVSVKNMNGEFSFYPKAESDETDSSSALQVNWYLEGVDEDKISTYKTSDIISAAAKVEAVMEITEKTFDECELNTPKSTVSVKSGSLGDFSITVGGTSPDNSGVYLYSSIDEKIYLVSSDIADTLDFTALDLASTDSVAAVSVDGENYVDSEGALSSFDSLTVSGSKFMNKVVIAPVSEEDATNVAFAYRITSPVNRYAETDNVTAVFTPFSSGISVSGVYSFDTDAAQLKKYGLDSPDTVLTLSAAGKSFTYKFALQDDGYYALFGDGMNTIKQISASAATFLSLDETDFYNKLVYIRSISELKNMTFTFADTVYSFDITENDDDADEKFTVYCGKKRIASENFQNFYMHFVMMSLIDFSEGKAANPDMTVKMTDNNGNVETLTFCKVSATEYYCRLGDTPLGKITASTYNKLISNIKTVSQNKDVGT